MKKTNKKICAFLLVGSMCLSLIGCTQNTEPENPENQDTASIAVTEPKVTEPIVTEPVQTETQIPQHEINTQKEFDDIEFPDEEFELGNNTKENIIKQRHFESADMSAEQTPAVEFAKKVLSSEKIHTAKVSMRTITETVIDSEAGGFFGSSMIGEDTSETGPKKSMSSTDTVSIFVDDDYHEKSITTNTGDTEKMEKIYEDSYYVDHILYKRNSAFSDQWFKAAPAELTQDTSRAFKMLFNNQILFTKDALVENDPATKNTIVTESLGNAFLIFLDTYLNDPMYADDQFIEYQNDVDPEEYEKEVNEVQLLFSKMYGDASIKYYYDANNHLVKIIINNAELDLANAIQNMLQTEMDQIDKSKLTRHEIKELENQQSLVTFMSDMFKLIDISVSVEAHISDINTQMSPIVLPFDKDELSYSDFDDEGLMGLDDLID